MEKEKELIQNIFNERCDDEEKLKNKFRNEGKLETLNIASNEPTNLSSKLEGAYFSIYEDLNVLFSAIGLKNLKVVSSYPLVSYNGDIAMFEYRLNNLDCHIFVYYDTKYSFYKEIVPNNELQSYYGAEENSEPKTMIRLSHSF